MCELREQSAASQVTFVSYIELDDGNTLKRSITFKSTRVFVCFIYSFSFFVFFLLYTHEWPTNQTKQNNTHESIHARCMIKQTCDESGNTMPIKSISLRDNTGDSCILIVTERSNTIL